MDWLFEKAYEFAGPPDESKLRLERSYDNITSKQCSNQWLGLSFIFKRKVSVLSNSNLLKLCTIILTHSAHCLQAAHYPVQSTLQLPPAPCHHGISSSHQAALPQAQSHSSATAKHCDAINTDHFFCIFVTPFSVGIHTLPARFQMECIGLGSQSNIQLSFHYTSLYPLLLEKDIPHFTAMPYSHHPFLAVCTIIVEDETQGE